MKKLHLMAAVLTALLLMIPSAVSAVGYGGVGGRPANPQPSNPRTSTIFIYELKGGQHTTDAVRVYNNTSTQQTISVYPVDSELASGGSFTCAQASDQKKDVGAWIKMQTESVTLAANSSQVVPFTVTVPKSAAVGEHDGCIAIQAASATRPTSKSGVLLSFRSAIRVVVTIPGKIVKKLDLTALNVSETKTGDYLVAPIAKNEGNVSLDTDIQVKLSSIFGMTTGSQGGTYPVLPHSSATWNLEVKHPFWGGWYRGKATATYNSSPNVELGVQQGASKTVQLTSAVVFVPPTVWAGLIELAVLLVVAVVLALYVRKQRDIRRIRKHWQEYTIKEDDTIAAIAKDSHTSWKKIARVNKLKAPYTLRKDQKLKVPPKRKA